MEISKAGTKTELPTKNRLGLPSNRILNNILKSGKEELCHKLNIVREQAKFSMHAANI